MAIAFVQSTAKQGSSSTVTTDPIDTSGANFIVMTMVYLTSHGTISDSKGNTPFLELTAQTAAGGATVRIAYFPAASCGTGHTFTIGSSASTFPSVSVGAFSGVATTSPFDQQNGATSAAGNPLATGSVTPGEDNELLWFGIGDQWNGTLSSSVGTIVNQLPWSAGVAFGISGCYQIQTTATARNPSLSWDGASVRAAAVIATFKSLAVSGGTQGKPLINSGLINHGLLSQSGLVG